MDKGQSELETRLRRIESKIDKGFFLIVVVIALYVGNQAYEAITAAHWHPLIALAATFGTSIIAVIVLGRILGFNDHPN